MDNNINDDDLLGRGIFSSGHAKQASKGHIKYNVFLEKGNKSLSMDRFNFRSKKITNIKALTSIQDKNAKLRTKTELVQRSFYGWAQITAALARRNSRTVLSVPLKSNPYHAEIHLPLDIERDEQIAHAKELASYSEWLPKFKKNQL